MGISGNNNKTETYIIIITDAVVWIKNYVNSKYLKGKIQKINSSLITK